MPVRDNPVDHTVQSFILKYRSAVERVDIDQLLELQEQIEPLFAPAKAVSDTDNKEASPLNLTGVETDSEKKVILQTLYDLNRRALKIVESERENLGKQLVNLKGAKAYGASA